MNVLNLKMIKTLKEKGLLVFNSGLINNYNLIYCLTWLRNIVKTQNIYFNSKLANDRNIYYSNKKLDLHIDWLWERNDNKYPLFLFLKCIEEPNYWWENFFLDSKKIFKYFPRKYLKLKYNFSLFSKKNIQKLFINHPLYWYACLNFTFYWINEKWISKYIKFIWLSEVENRFIISFLYEIQSTNTFYINLVKNKAILFDNYRFLHWRNIYKWYRELERYCVYL